MTLIGPFNQLLTMRNLPSCGPIADSALEIIENAGMLITNGTITAIGPYKEFTAHQRIEISGVCLPGLIDAHTHICFAGNRSADYALRLSGASYQEIAKRGGGIRDTVRKTEAASLTELESGLAARIERLKRLGVTTCEVKTGYGDELKMLEAIRNQSGKITLIPTCLAAHVRPLEFKTNSEYLKHITEKLLPKIKSFTKRIDIFVDETAFTSQEAEDYLKAAREMGFSILIHADQFSRGGSALAAKLHVLSADHLEFTNKDDADALKQAGVIPIVLPGATLGLGMQMPPARMLLDADLPLVIASDWNPGSAPMGNLMLQAALLGAEQKLTIAETFAALTARAARALELSDRGILAPGARADFITYNTTDYRDILYYQGSLTPAEVFTNGECIYGTCL